MAGNINFPDAPASTPYSNYISNQVVRDYTNKAKLSNKAAGGTDVEVYSGSSINLNGLTAHVLFDAPTYVTEVLLFDTVNSLPVVKAVNANVTELPLKHHNPISKVVVLNDGELVTQAFEQTATPAIPFPQHMGTLHYPNLDDDAAAVYNSLGMGMNLGQTWDAIKYGSSIKIPGAYRSASITSWHFELLKKLGFDHVRMPIRVDSFAGADTVTPDYSLNQTDLEAYFLQVEDAVSHGLKVIIDNHNHLGPLCLTNTKKTVDGVEVTNTDGHPLFYADINDYQAFLDNRNNILKPRNTAFMSEFCGLVAARFSYQDVLIELENEPNGAFNADWADYLPGYVTQCRAAVDANRGTDPGIIFLVGGSNYNNPNNLGELANLPVGETRTIGVAHNYAEHQNFTHYGVNNQIEATTPRIWSEEYRNTLENQFKTAAKKSAELGIPIAVTEIGTVYKTDLTNAHKYFRDVRDFSGRYGMPFSLWCFFSDFRWNNRAGVFAEGVLEALLGHEIPYADIYPQREAGKSDIVLEKSPITAHNFLTGSPSTVLDANLTSTFDKPGITIIDDKNFTIDTLQTGAHSIHLTHAVLRGSSHIDFDYGRPFKFYWKVDGNETATCRIYRAGADNRINIGADTDQLYAGSVPQGQEIHVTFNNLGGDEDIAPFYKSVMGKDLWIGFDGINVGDTITVYGNWED